MQDTPCVQVLLAAYNGMQHITAQLASVLSQTRVKVCVAISVDCSSDGTQEWAYGVAKRDPRVVVLPSLPPFGSAAANFFRLLEALSDQPTSVDYVALADQDDLWYPDKLARAVEAIGSGRCEAASTSVVAFWPDGRRKLVDKGQHLRLADHWFESAGPGCTYVLRADVAKELSVWVAAHREALCGVDFHDWLVYAWARSRGYRWWIDPQPSMDYRQHSHNVLGAHSGLAGMTKRLRMLLGGWYLQQVLRIADVCDANSQQPIARLRRDRWYDRLALVSQVGQMRRKPLDRLALAIALLFGRRSPP